MKDQKAELETIREFITTPSSNHSPRPQNHSTTARKSEHLTSPHLTDNMSLAHWWASIKQEDATTTTTTTALPTNYINLLKSSPTLTLLILLILTLLLTRLTSQHNTHSPNKKGPKTPPKVPYWIPLLGHIPNMALNSETFIPSLRALYSSSGIFTLNLFGSRHNVMYTPGLATALLNQKNSHADSEEVGWKLMVKIFGFPSREREVYEESLEDLKACYRHVLSEPFLGNMVERTKQLTRENVGSLVTFLESPVDLMGWEKRADVEVVETQDRGKVVEANLLELIRDFCAHTANPSIMGTDFLNNFPDFFEGIWKLDRGFLLLATGLPRWFPIPALTRAHIARRQNVEKCIAYHEQLEKWSKGQPTDAKWSSLEDVGSLEKARLEVYQKHGWSIRARAATEHALLWAANANSNTLVFWMVNRIYEDRALLEMLREEIAPYVEIVQEKTGLPIQEPPRIDKIDVDGLCNNCPLLKSTYVECLRIDTASWSLKVVKQDFVLQSREKDSQPWLLKKGDYAHAAHDLHNTDPKYWEDPMVFKPDRHIKYDEKKQGTADLGSIRPYGM